MTIRLDGPVTKGTKDNLIEGVRSSAMSEEAVGAVFKQTAVIASGLIDIYRTGIAEGEVGENGSGRASSDAIVAADPPTALIYGRVQSGKTVAMILTAALCLDNGFRVVVVLTTDNVALVGQTADRFRDLAGPRIFAGVKVAGSYDWEGQQDDLKQSVPTNGMVIVCAKNSVNLPEVMNFLQAVDAAAYPVLVLDDEADAATPDTTVAARAKGSTKAPAQPSRMYRLVVENKDPGELGFSLRERLPHSLYVQVTATPYVLFLQKEGERLRPSGTYLLEPGSGYTGGEAYFGSFDASDTAAVPEAPIVLVDATESATIKREVPNGLVRSIDFFLLSACALSRAEQGWPKGGLKHLSHTSHTTTEHKIVSEHITGHLNHVRRTLASDDGEAYFALAFAELLRTVPDAPSLSDLLKVCRRALPHADVYRVNSKVKPLSYGPRLNFLVGGNILGRGLTIGNLLVTYYVRQAKVSQMDTVWQHARMFGYRKAYLSYTRVYLPRQLATRFSELHEGEELLRRAVNDGDIQTILIRLPASSRATRPNVVDPNIVRGIRAGRKQVNPAGWIEDRAAARKIVKLLSNGNPALLEDSPRDQRGATLSFEQCIELIQNVPVAKDDIWDRDVITALFKSYEEKADSGELFVYVRELAPTSRDRTKGRLSGDEIELLRRKKDGLPALALLHIGEFPSPDAWFPTVVMPANSPGFVFSND